ncbi:MAG: flavodoxin [Bulleidia sp.]
MKRTMIGLLLSAALLTGCSSSASAETPAASAAASTAAASSESTAAAAETTGSRILVMYFDQGLNSDSSGETEEDAVTSASLADYASDDIVQNDILVMKNEIISVTGADEYAIRVNETYADSYYDMVDGAQTEQNEDRQFTFRTPLPDLSDYDVIFLGTPVWWAHLPQPVVNVFEQLDFSGKTIIPFGIHLGSRFGRMLSQMAELEPDASISSDGLTISGHTGNDEAREQVDEWLAGLGY